MTDRRAALLEHTARRACERPEYLGWVLARYMESEGVSWSALAAMLGGSVEFAPLALCLRPRAEHFAADVHAIAQKFALDPAELARIIRFVDALEAMTDRVAEAPPGYGTLLAARERKKKEEDDGEPGAG